MGSSCMLEVDWWKCETAAEMYQTRWRGSTQPENPDFEALGVVRSGHGTVVLCKALHHASRIASQSY